MTKYNKEIEKYSDYCYIALGKSFSDISSNQNRSEEENKIVEMYRWNSFFLDNNSVVNRISRYMRANLGLVGKFANKTSKEFNYKLLLSNNFTVDSNKLSTMLTYLQHYKSFKRGLWYDIENSMENIDAFVAYLKKQCYENISSNDSELADYCVQVSYGNEVSMVEFAWKMFPQGLLENIQSNSNNIVKIPTVNSDGNIEYLWNKYSLESFSLE